MMISKKVQFWRVIDARTRDALVSCFVTLVYDLFLEPHLKPARLILIWFSKDFFFFVGNKGFTCQLCGLVRDKEEIKNTVHEIQSLSEKASISLPCGRIL